MTPSHAMLYSPPNDSTRGILFFDLAAEMIGLQRLNDSSCFTLQVSVFSGVTDSARRVLTSMARRDVKQRFILAFIAAVLIIAIAVTIYYTTQKSKK
jgi:hypothetical protein